jgi:hypothetical protein
LTDISVLAGEKDAGKGFGGKLGIRILILQPSTPTERTMNICGTVSIKPPIIIILSLFPSADPVMHLHYAAAIYEFQP